MVVAVAVVVIPVVVVAAGVVVVAVGVAVNTSCVVINADERCAEKGDNGVERVTSVLITDGVRSTAPAGETDAGCWRVLSELIGGEVRSPDVSIAGTLRIGNKSTGCVVFVVIVVVDVATWVVESTAGVIASTATLFVATGFDVAKYPRQKTVESICGSLKLLVQIQLALE
jgi:hypothetical protein